MRGDSPRGGSVLAGRLLAASRYGDFIPWLQWLTRPLTENHHVHDQRAVSPTRSQGGGVEPDGSVRAGM